MNRDLKLKFYYNHVLSETYSEPHSTYHQQITHDVIERFIRPLQLNMDARILDLGSGRAYFLDRMRALGYTDVTGITLSVEDYNHGVTLGHRMRHADMNFLQDTDESQDLLFSRHSIEHSPFPYISLLEYNRVLKPRGWLYIETPRPDSERPHENNRNHYSILGRTQWLALLTRTGFDVTWHEYDFPIVFDDGRQYKESYYVFLCQRRRPVDVK